MYRHWTAPLLLSIFVISCGSPAQQANDIQNGPADGPITAAAALGAGQPASLLKCLTRSGWELEVAIKDATTLVLNFASEADDLNGDNLVTLQTQQSIELVRTNMHNDYSSGSRVAFGVSKVSKVIGSKGPILPSKSKTAQSVADYLKSANLSQIELIGQLDQKKTVSEAKAMFVAKNFAGANSRISMDALTCASRPELFLEMSIAK